MAAAAVALTLEGVNLSQLASIQVPLAAGQAVWDAEQQQEDEGDEPMLMPPPLPAGFAALSRALAGVRALASPALPFAVHVLGQDQLRVVMLKSHVAAVFKLLRAQQGSLGIMVRDVKSQVSLAPLPGVELEQACAAGLLASLLAPACGWWQLDEHRLLGASLVAPSPDGQPQACGSLTLGVHVQHAAVNRLTLLVKPEQVEFRHPACRPGASLAARSASLAGSECRLLPDFREGLIEGLLPADEATLQRLRPLWASYGTPLPALAPEHLVEVRLSDDPDATAFPYPPCCVLSRYGLMSSADKLAAPAVQGVLAKLRDDLAATPFKFLGDKLRVAGAHVWYPDGAPVPPTRGREKPEEEQPAQLAFVTGRQLEQQLGKGRGGATGRQLALGGPIDLSGFAAGGSGGGSAVAGSAQQQAQQRKKEHAVPDAKLQAYMDALKRQYGEQQKPAPGPGQLPGLALAAATAGNGAAATAAARATPGKQQPLALRQAQAAAAAAGGASQKPLVPMFKKGGAAPAAAPKKAAAQKRAGQGGAKPPAAAKRAKAAAAPASAAATPQASAAPGFLPSSGPALPASCAATPAAAAGAGSVPPSAAKPAATAGLAGAGTGGGAGAAGAPPKAPAKPRAKAADVDVAAVTAKVLAMHVAGTLGKLTIPELKAYLKSLCLPVGGKKGELEERARQALGGAATVAAAANAVPAVEP